MPGETQSIKQSIPQHMLVLRDFCIRTFGCECNRCEAACPKSAINIVTSAKKAAPTIDAKACTNCCVCIGVCDAFTGTQTTLVNIYSHARRIALSQAGREVIFTCSECAPKSESVASNVIVLGCLAAIPSELWLQLLTNNTNVSIALEMGKCKNCSNNKGNPNAENLMDAAISKAESWAKKNIGFSEDIPLAVDESLIAGLMQQGGSSSRRDMFSGVFNQFKDVASGDYRKRTDTSLNTFDEETERKNAHNAVNLTSTAEFNKYAPLGRVKTTLHPRQKMLIASVSKKPEIAADITINVPETNKNLCENCLVCTRFCPTGARYPSPNNGNLEFKVHLCIGCKMCQNICKKNAVEIKESTAEILINCKNND